MSLRPFAPWHAAQSDAKRGPYAAALVSAADAAGCAAPGLAARDTPGLAAPGGEAPVCASAPLAASTAERRTAAAVPKRHRRDITRRWRRPRCPAKPTSLAVADAIDRS